MRGLSVNYRTNFVQMDLNTNGSRANPMAFHQKTTSFLTVYCHATIGNRFWKCELSNANLASATGFFFTRKKSDKKTCLGKRDVGK